jgi:hypothetical protein
MKRTFSSNNQHKIWLSCSSSTIDYQIEKKSLFNT